MPSDMRAAVLHAPGDIRIERVPVPTPGPGEVRIRVLACGVCGSDLGRMLRYGAHHMPIITGHEFSGLIDEIGVGVEGFSPGELVTVAPLIPCFKCGACVQGKFGLCEDYDYVGSRRDGAYAEYVTVPVQNLLRVPAGLDPAAAAMTDPAAVALHALWRCSVTLGSRVAVVGCGPIGLFAIQYALLAGASEVIAMDVSPQAAELARKAGAAVAVTSDEDAIASRGAGCDAVIESAGVQAAENLAVEMAGRHATVAYIGIPNKPVELSASAFNRMLRLELSLTGSWNSFSAPFPGAEWRVSLEKLASGDLDWEFMITHRLALEDLPGMFEKLVTRSEFSSKIIFDLQK